MRIQSFAVTAAMVSVLAVTSAEARTAFAGNRVGGSVSAERSSEGLTLLETMAALLGVGVSAKATPVVGSDAPRSAAPRTEQCEEEKKRAEAAKAAETRRTADAEKPRARGGEPLYLAF
jgi:hypothetical protein